MPAVAAIAAVASAAVGVAGVIQQKRAADQQQDQFDKQREAALEAAKLEKTRTEAGAKVKLGTPDRNSGGRSTGARGGAARQGTVANAVGGVAASQRLGL